MLLLLLGRKNFVKSGLHTASRKKTYSSWNVLFFGTDRFSLRSLEALHEKYKSGQVIKRLDVVTNLKGKSNEVRKFAEKQNLILHNWPATVPENTYDLGLVVSFGHLIPENIINKFRFGMLNVHASLLPRWRGAAPIIYAIAKGDKKTGVTIMKIKPDKFDVGEIVSQEAVHIADDIKMPELHEMLARVGARNLIKAVEEVPECLHKAKKQPETGVTLAPRVNPSFAEIKWNEMSKHDVYNLERAVSGLFVPSTVWNGMPVKLQNISLCETACKKSEDLRPGYVIYDKNSDALKVLCLDGGWINVKQIGVYGKKLMNARDFNNGYVKKVPNEMRYFK